MKKHLIGFLFLFAITQLQAQEKNCNCSNELNWIIKTFEENDAGFQHVIDQKGKAAYAAHNNLFKTQATTTQNIVECADLIKKWFLFFRNGHLSLKINKEFQQNPNTASSTLSNKEIIKKYSNSPIYNTDIAAFKKRIKKEKKAGFEGLWEMDNYLIGIEKDKSVKTEKYIGFIIEADGVYWTKNQIKLVIEKKNGKYIADFGLKDHSIRNLNDVELMGKNYLRTNWVIWKRMDTPFKTEASIINYFSFLWNPNPQLKQISENTLVLRIPSFKSKFKPQIDSILKSNHELITKTKNLIIDIRGNGGGSDSSYSEILPYIYTNPIKQIGVALLSTPLNNARMDKIAAIKELPEKKRKWALDSKVVLNKRIGEFVNLKDSIVRTFILDKKYKYPQNVGIIINKKNGSTAEQFLLDAKQSKKVKLFGVTTGGVLDISNMNFVKTPSKIFRLGYSLSKSFRIPDFTIDGIGLQPDYFIHKSIPKHEWILYTEKILNEN